MDREEKAEDREEWKRYKCQGLQQAVAPRMIMKMI